MAFGCLTLAALIALSSVCEGRAPPRAVTENGPVVGTYETSYSGHQYRAFKGIPYAEPPVGGNRFKEPQKLKHKWVGEWQATDYGAACLHLNEFSEVKHQFIMLGDEDCLFLNVFTREGGPAKKDVIFMIHGGAFMFGSSDMYGPKYMMDQEDVVYVTVNYRLGPLGFLTTGDGVVPGNNGLKDQTAALQWVSRNIAHFGGDPAKVTLAGLSAGGASVDYHFLTTLSKGLFTKGISFSGSALSPWALVQNGAERSQKLAQGLGCPTKESAAMVKCLRRRPARQIVDQMRSLFVWVYHPFTVFGPVVEVGAAQPFIDRSPAEIHRLGLGQQLPWIGGVTTEEGLYPLAGFIDDDSMLKKINDDWLQLGPSLLFLDPKLSQQESQRVLKAAKKYYLGDADINASTVKPLLQLFTDRLYAVGLVETALHRAGGRLYQYGYQSATSVAHAIAYTVKDYGASHGDDVISIVDFSMIPSHTTARDVQMAQVIKDIFFAFVRSGKVPDKYNWEPLATSNSYLRIKSPEDVSTTNEPFVNVEDHKQIFASTSQSRDEL